MIQQTVIIKKTKDNFAWVSVLDEAGGCHSCSSKNACSSLKLFNPIVGDDVNSDGLKVLNSLNANIGDRVTLEISSYSLLKSTFLVYVLPLLTLLLGAVLGKLFWGETTSVFLGIIGFVMGVYIAKCCITDNSQKNKIEPSMLKGSLKLDNNQILFR